MVINNEPWFVGKDVAEILGYSDTNKAVAMHVDEDDKKFNDKTSSSFGQRGATLINESGLYAMVISSKLPTAKQFKRWVTSEVLPSIRKTGKYAVPHDSYVSHPTAKAGGLATLNFGSPNKYQETFSYHIGYMVNVDCSTSGTLTRPDSPKIYSGAASFLILGFSLPDTQRVPSI